MNGRGHVLDLLSAYALDALDEAEAALVSAHLAECASCRAQFAGLAETAGRLADLDPSEPPLQLRGRVLAAIEAARAEQAAAALSPVAPPARRPQLAAPRPLRWNWVRWGQATAAIALLASQVWLIATLISLRAQVAVQGGAQTILLSSNEAPVNLQSPDPASTARGVYHYERDLQRGLINYYHLLPLGPGRSYQCWMEFANQTTLPCGRLTIDPDGAGLLLISWSKGAPGRIRVTLETGSPAAPLGPTILLGAIQP